MDAREASDDDAALLREFRSATTDEFYDQEVEDLARKSLVWRRDDPSRHVLLFEEDGELLCVAGYGAWVTPLAPHPGVWFYFLAVRIGHHRRGAGSEAFDEVISRVSSAYSKPVGWYVHPDNVKSQGLCEKLGHLTWRTDDEPPYMRIYTIWA